MYQLFFISPYWILKWNEELEITLNNSGSAKIYEIIINIYFLEKPDHSNPIWFSQNIIEELKKHTITSLFLCFIPCFFPRCFCNCSIKMLLARIYWTTQTHIIAQAKQLNGQITKSDHVWFIKEKMDRIALKKFLSQI